MVMDIKCTEFSNVGYAVIFLGQAQEIIVRYGLTLQLSDQIFNSPHCQPYNSYNISSEN